MAAEKFARLHASTTPGAQAFSVAFTFGVRSAAKEISVKVASTSVACHSLPYRKSAKYALKAIVRNILRSPFCALSIGPMSVAVIATTHFLETSTVGS